MSSSQSVKILYLDDTCKITDCCIILFKYYFPFPSSRSILFTEIQSISLNSALHATNKWGPNLHNLNTWFSHDRNRRNKNQYIAFHLKDKKIVPCFSPLDAGKVYNILKEWFEEHGYGAKFQEKVVDQESCVKVDEIQHEEKEYLEKKEQKEEKPFLEESGDDIQKQKRKHQSLN